MSAILRFVRLAFEGKTEPTTKTDARTALETKTLVGAVQVFFRFSTPQLLTVKVLVFFGVNLYLGDFSIWDWVIATSILVYWPLQEWFLHAYLLHFKPIQILGFTFDPFAGRLHRYHHRYPWILETIFLPTRVIAALIPIHILLWIIAMPSASLAASGIFLFTLATLVYEWTHYLTHTQYKPKTSYVRRIFRNHRLHHFKNEKYWYSFTVPYVDVIFRTSPRVDQVESSSTCRTLGVDGETLS